MTERTRALAADVTANERQRRPRDRREDKARAKRVNDPGIAELLRKPRLVKRADGDHRDRDGKEHVRCGGHWRKEATGCVLVDEQAAEGVRRRVLTAPDEHVQGL